MDALDDALEVIARLNEAGVDYIVVDYPSVRYGPPEGTLYLDILTRLGETTRYADLEAEEREIVGVRVRVATPMTLYRMKRDTLRPIDKADAQALRSAFDIQGGVTRDAGLQVPIRRSHAPPGTE